VTKLVIWRQLIVVAVVAAVFWAGAGWMGAKFETDGVTRETQAPTMPRQEQRQNTFKIQDSNFLDFWEQQRRDAVNDRLRCLEEQARDPSVYRWC